MQWYVIFIKNIRKVFVNLNKSSSNTTVFKYDWHAKKSDE